MNMMQDYDVIFDRANKRIGWVRECVHIRVWIYKEGVLVYRRMVRGYDVIVDRSTHTPCSVTDVIPSTISCTTACTRRTHCAHTHIHTACTVHTHTVHTHGAHTHTHNTYTAHAKARSKCHAEDPRCLHDACFCDGDGTCPVLDYPFLSPAWFKYHWLSFIFMLCGLLALITLICMAVHKRRHGRYCCFKCCAGGSARGGATLTSKPKKKNLYAPVGADTSTTQFTVETMPMEGEAVQFREVPLTSMEGGVGGMGGGGGMVGQRMGQPYRDDDGGGDGEDDVLDLGFEPSHAAMEANLDDLDGLDDLDDLDDLDGPSVGVGGVGGSTRGGIHLDVDAADVPGADFESRP